MSEAQYKEASRRLLDLFFTLIIRSSPSRLADIEALIFGLDSDKITLEMSQRLSWRVSSFSKGGKKWSRLRDADLVVVWKTPVPLSNDGKEVRRTVIPYASFT